MLISKMTNKIEKLDFNSRRMLFKIILNEKKYIIKISPIIDRFRQEALIYQELTKYSMSDDQIKNKIVKICDFGYLELSDSAILLALNIDNNTVNFDITIHKQDFLHMTECRKHTCFQYFVTEYNDEFTIFKKFICEKSTNLNNEMLTDFYLELFKCLFHLHKKYGFNHWDLHTENILLSLKDKKIHFKLFDFDLSSTDAHSKLLYRSNNQTSNEKSKKEGLCHDIVMIFSLDKYGNQKFKPMHFSSELLKLLNKLKSKTDSMYMYLHHVDWKMGTTDHRSDKRLNIYELIEQIVKFDV